MVQSLQLATVDAPSGDRAMRRLNRLPVIAAIVLILLFVGIVVAGLSLRGLSFDSDSEIEAASDAPATSFGDQLKRGIGNGIIGDQEQRETFQPSPPASVERQPAPEPQPTGQQPVADPVSRSPSPETDAEWKVRLAREHEEQKAREENRQRMARLQAQATALDSPLSVDISAVASPVETSRPHGDGSSGTSGAGRDLYTAAMKAGFEGQNNDPNGQGIKEDFFNHDIKELGYLPNQVVVPMSRYELKRGSVIPAILITGLNSDLPGRITAQVSQDVYDSATGRQLLIPQGAKLLGRYDSKISFGQQRVLVVWTDLILANGSTLQIGGMAGMDAEGYGGFADKINRHAWRTFGSAALIALIGTGIDMSIPESSTLSTRDTASDAARRNFAETFGRAAEQTISKNLDVQPTIRIRPGYRFNVLVDQDVVFPASYRH